MKGAQRDRNYQVRQSLFLTHPVHQACTVFFFFFLSSYVDGFRPFLFAPFASFHSHCLFEWNERDGVRKSYGTAIWKTRSSRPWKCQTVLHVREGYSRVSFLSSAPRICLIFFLPSSTSFHSFGGTFSLSLSIFLSVIVFVITLWLRVFLTHVVCVPHGRRKLVPQRILNVYGDRCRELRFLSSSGLRNIPIEMFTGWK